MHEREHKRQVAREALEAGQHVAAARTFLECGDPDEAGRALFQGGHFVEAATLLLREAGLAPSPPWHTSDARALDEVALRRARAAARCFQRAGQVDLAVRLRLALGEPDAAIELLRAAGRHDDAKRIETLLRERNTTSSLGSAMNGPVARPGDVRGTMPRPGPAPPPTTPDVHGSARVPGDTVSRLETQAREYERLRDFDRASSLWEHLERWGDAARTRRMAGRTDDALALYARADMPWEAGLVALELGRHDDAVRHFLRVARTGPRYRDACVELVKLHVALQRYDFPFVDFLGPFLLTPPVTDPEVRALWDVARLAETEGDLEAAMSAVLAVALAFPKDAGVERQRQRIEAKIRGSDAEFRRVVEDNVAFHRNVSASGRGAPMAPLPDLPDLPPLPGAGVPAARSNPPTPSAPAGGSPAAASNPAGLSNLPGLHVPAAPSRPSGGWSRASGSVPSAPPIATGALPQVVDDWQGEPTQTDFSGTGPDLRIDAHGAAPDGSTRHVEPPSFHPDRAQGRSDLTSSPSMSSPGRGAAVSDERWKGLEAGSVLASRYRFERKLGQGGMAIVFLATDLELQEEVAVKIFTRPLDDPQLVRRFKQELSLSRKLVHPNVIRLYDIGNADGLRYITMEVLEGRDLHAFCGRPRPIGQVLDLVAQAARGLHAAHQKGVVHRDVKPHNIFLCNDGVVKVMDFGIARQTRAEGMTVGNFVAGTPEYMSPEQISGFSTVGPSTDIYALGVVLYQLLTGRLPFEHDEMLPLLMMHLNQAPEPPRSHRVDLPAELDALILGLLAKTPEARPANADELARSLDQLRARLGEGV